MKRLGTCALVLLFVLAGWFVLQAATEVTTVTKNVPFGMSGSNQLVTPASAAWTLASIEADADSSVFSTVLDLTNGDTVLPKQAIVYVVWASAAGGSTSTNFTITLCAHGAATATAGSNATQFDNRIPLGAWNVGPSVAAVVNCKATAAGEAFMFPCAAQDSTGIKSPIVLPRYVSINLQKEGNGKFTAGTVTVYVYPYPE